MNRSLRRVLPVTVVAAVFVAVLGGCGGEAPFPSVEETSQLVSLRKLRTPPRSPTNQFADSPAAAALGKKLFHDPAFSGCGTTSCATCHAGPGFAVDAEVPAGCGGNGARNAPTLLNVAFNDWLGWDGRKDSVWSQAMFPLLNPAEMAATAPATRARMESTYSAEYQAAFGKTPAQAQSDEEALAYFGKALEAYERSFIAVDAPFDDKLDQFLAAAAAGNAEKDPFYLPLKTFARKGQCIVCHKGPMLSDGLFHNVGLKQSGMDHGRATAIPNLLTDAWNGAGIYSDDKRTGANKLDALKTLTDADKEGAFKTPTLRNVAVTGPYMHTGKEQSLADVVEFYNRGGDLEGSFPGTRTVTIVPLNLTTEEKAALVDLLGTLTGREDTTQF